SALHPQQPEGPGSSETDDTIPLTGLTISGPSEVGLGKRITLSAKLTPANATGYDLVWKSSSPSVATVENGVVTGVKRGRTTITVYNRKNTSVK
uniref:Ig-like domain-containing protein n=1 Tax=Klebsiella pneumoniae TaxID=573 RepID=UPI00163D5464